MPGVGARRCKHCNALVYERDEAGHCLKCQPHFRAMRQREAAIDAEVDRLMPLWSSDLDLLVRFDAYCAEERTSGLGGGAGTEPRAGSDA